MAQSRIIDYNSDMDHVIWWYEDHETKEYVEVYDSILAFMKKLIRVNAVMKCSLLKLFFLEDWRNR